MNSDPRFRRARIRRLMPLLAATASSRPGLAATARRLASAAEAIDDAPAGSSRRRWRSMVRHGLDRPRAFTGEPGEVRRRVLVRLLIAVGGGDYPPRFERLGPLRRPMRRSSGRAGSSGRSAGTSSSGGAEGSCSIGRRGRTGCPRLALGAGYAGAGIGGSGRASPRLPGGLGGCARSARRGGGRSVLRSEGAPPARSRRCRRCGAAQRSLPFRRCRWFRRRGRSVADRRPADAWPSAWPSRHGFPTFGLAN